MSLLLGLQDYINLHRNILKLPVFVQTAVLYETLPKCSMGEPLLT